MEPDRPSSVLAPDVQDGLDEHRQKGNPAKGHWRMDPECFVVKNAASVMATLSPNMAEHAKTGAIGAASPSH